MRSSMSSVMPSPSSGHGVAIVWSALAGLRLVAAQWLPAGTSGSLVDPPESLRSRSKITI